MWQKRPTLLTQRVNDNENPNSGLLLSIKDNYMKKNILEYRPMTAHTETTCCVQLDAPVQVQRQDSHNCWMRCWSDELCPPPCQPRCLSTVHLVPALAGRTPARVPAPRVKSWSSRQDTHWCFGYPPVGSSTEMGAHFLLKVAGHNMLCILQRSENQCLCKM